MNGKQLLLIGIILSVLILCLPVSGALECSSGMDCDLVSGSNMSGAYPPVLYSQNWLYYANNSLTSSAQWDYAGVKYMSCYAGTPTIDEVIPDLYSLDGSYDEFALSYSPACKCPTGYIDDTACSGHSPSSYDYGDYVVGLTYNGGTSFTVRGIWDYVDNYNTGGSVDFTGTPLSGLSPLTVVFQDTSSFTPTMINYWEFGDGNTFTAPTTYFTTAQHTYTSAGWYDVKHLAFDLSGNYGWANKTSYIEVLSSSNGTVSGYTMFVNPETVIYNSNFTITTTSINSKFDGITNIKFGYTKGSESNILDSADGNILDYVNTSGTWYQYNVNNHLYDIPLSGVPSSIINIPAKMGSGTYTIDGYITKTTGQVIHLTDSLIITTDNQQTLSIHAIDFNDGYIVSTAHINVLDISHNIWDNRSIGGDKVFYYPYGQKLYIDVNSTSYYTSSKNYTVTSSPTNTVQVVMYRGINTPAGNVTLRVNVMDTLGGYLNNAKVTTLNDESYFDSQSKYTNYAGVSTFTVLPNTDYAISVSKTGYLSAGKLINSGTGGLTLDTTIVLSTGANPTATPTPLPTTASGQYTGNIGGSNITPVTCRTVLPQGSTLLDTLRNNMACAGITSGQNQGFGIALMIIFTLGVIGGKYGKGMGVVMGMSAGYVLSLAMNLVPLWTFIAMLIFICLILAVKIWSSDK